MTEAAKSLISARSPITEAAFQDDRVSFDCPAGTVLGWADGDVWRATGIRYARAERFSPPTPEPVARERVDATRPAPMSPQLPSELLTALTPLLVDNLPQDEHCQHLSITMPAGVLPGERLPVMVWIHGGSYVMGSGDGVASDPAALVREQRVIVVAVTYRLGILGFLGGTEQRPANLGLLDQLEALRWVNRNIASFGGDPRNVTVFGESAGGDAITKLLIADGAEGLFQRAIVQSAPLGHTSGRAPMHAAMLAATEDVSAAMPIPVLLQAQQQAQQAAAGFGLRATMPFSPQFGHAPLPAEAEADAAAAGAAREVDLLIGTNKREAALFAGEVPVLTRVARIPGIGTALLELVIRAFTWRLYSRPAGTFARRYARAGGHVTQYVLEWGPPGRYEAAHGIELALLLGTRGAWESAPVLAGRTWSEIDEAGRQLRRIWAGFARTGQAPAHDSPGLLRFRRHRTP